MRVAKIRIDAEVELPEDDVGAAKTIVQIDEALKRVGECLPGVTLAKVDASVSMATRRQKAESQAAG